MADSLLFPHKKYLNRKAEKKATADSKPYKLLSLQLQEKVYYLKEVKK